MAVCAGSGGTARGEIGGRRIDGAALAVFGKRRESIIFAAARHTAYPAIAQPTPTCERGPNSGRALACSELLRGEQSPERRAVIYRNRGEAYSWAGQYDLAVSDFDSALVIDPDDVDALYQRGFAFYAMQAHDRAVADTDRLIALGEKAKNYAVYQLRCHALAALGRYDEAIRSCSEQLRPFAREIFYVDRGEVYLLAGQNDRAIEDFDAALKINSKMAHAIFGRGKALFAKQDYAAALEEFSRADLVVRQAVGQPWAMALSKHGPANEALGRRSAAIADFQQALKAQLDLDESKNGLKRLGASSTPITEKPWWRFW
jgi:tetratricopeptide (TPR) repeat protein